MFKKLFSFFWDKSLLSFALIGIFNTLVTMVGSQLLYRSLGYWGSTLLFYLLTSIFSFFMNRRFSFQSKAPLSKSAIKFAVSTTICYLVSYSVAMPLMRWFAGAFFPALSVEWIDRIAMLVAQVLFNVCNYVSQRLWTFKN